MTSLSGLNRAELGLSISSKIFLFTWDDGPTRDLPKRELDLS